MAEQKPKAKRKGCLGCSFPVLIIFILLLVIGFLGRNLGKALFKGIHLPSWLTVPTPEVALPSEAIAHLGPLPITNSLITQWIGMVIIAAILIGLSVRAKIIPGKFQSAIESILEWVLNLCKDVAGEHNGPRPFPIIVTIFLFVVVNAWMNLLPGIGSITIKTEEGVVPLFRGANTDINTPLALAIVSFIMVEAVGFAGGGFKYLKKFFNFGRLGEGFTFLFKGKVGKGFAGLGYGFIDAFVGILELLSEIFRLFSFTFRLFGNMLGGEILVLMMFFLVTYVLVIPFYGLELLVGAVQALIFSALTLVFASISSTPHEEHL